MSVTEKVIENAKASSSGLLRQFVFGCPAQPRQVCAKSMMLYCCCCCCYHHLEPTLLGLLVDLLTCLEPKLTAGVWSLLTQLSPCVQYFQERGWRIQSIHTRADMVEAYRLPSSLISFETNYSNGVASYFIVATPQHRAATSAV